MNHKDGLFEGARISEAYREIELSLFSSFTETSRQVLPIIRKKKFSQLQVSSCVWKDLWNWGKHSFIAMMKIYSKLFKTDNVKLHSQSNSLLFIWNYGEEKDRLHICWCGKHPTFFDNLHLIDLPLDHFDSPDLIDLTYHHASQL